MKRKIIILAVTIIILTCLGFPAVTYARENTITRDYAKTTLTCYIKCTPTLGTGSTDGANMDGLRNYVKVCIYDINHNIKASREKKEIKKASCSIPGAGIYMTRTFHAATNTSGYQVLPSYQQIKQTQGR